MVKYAGIGSRETTDEALNTMHQIAKELSSRGWMLRSGNADGADKAFQNGNDGVAEIFLPWDGYNSLSRSCSGVKVGTDLSTYVQAERIASMSHPAWDRCSQGARKLHTRNVFIVLGATLTEPVDCVICWTKDGTASGGTGQAIRLAEFLKIPVFNLYHSDTLTQLEKFVINH